MTETTPWALQQITAFDMIFACTVCQIPLSCINNDHAGLHYNSDSGGHKIAKLWFAVPCAHLSCAKHFEGGGVPFYPQGQLPQAPCPHCVKEKDDHTNRVLYYINGESKSDCHPNISHAAFQNLNLMQNGPEAETLRFHYCALVRFGQKMYEKNRQLHNQIEDLRHQEISRPDQSPSTLRSGSRPEDGARSSVKRRRLAKSDASLAPQSDTMASQTFSSIPNHQNQLSYARTASSPMPPNNQVCTPLKLHNPRGPEQPVLASTAHRYPLSRQYDTLKARLAIQAASAATHISPGHHDPTRQAPSSELKTRSTVKPSHNLSIDYYPLKTHTPAFDFSSDPRQAAAPSWSQQTREYYPLQSQNHQSSANISTEIPRHRAQSFMLSQRTSITSRPTTSLECPHPKAMEGIQPTHHQHHEYFTTPTHHLASQPFSRSGRRDVPFQWCPPPPPPPPPRQAPINPNIFSIPQAKAPLYSNHPAYPSIPSTRARLPSRGGPGLSNQARSSGSSSNYFSHSSVL